MEYEVQTKHDEIWQHCGVFSSPLTISLAVAFAFIGCEDIHPAGQGNASA